MLFRDIFFGAIVQMRSGRLWLLMKEQDVPLQILD
jgi:hypothetical protein